MDDLGLREGRPTRDDPDRGGRPFAREPAGDAAPIPDERGAPKPAERRRRDSVAARLGSARYPLGAAGVVAIIAIVAGAPPFWTAAGFALVIAAAGLGPRRTRAQRLADRAAELRHATRPDRSVPAVSVIDALSHPAFLLDGAMTVRHENPAAAAAFGGGSDGVAARMRFRGPELRQLIERATRERRAVRLRGFRIAGRESWYEVHLSPLEAAGPGEARAWLLLFQDETEARRDAQIRADFIANASHELRTPLASLTGYIETLQGSARNDHAARERFLGIMQEQARRMARLVEDLMSLSRLERRARLRPDADIDLVETVAHAVDAARPAFVADGIALTLEAPDGPLSVRGDRDELVQVVENLVENALRYGGSGGRVHVAVERRAGRARVSVRDWGPGIAPEHLPRLTERFYRVDVEHSRARRGTGLGLAIVKHILGRHASRLQILSEPGAGATFAFALACDESGEERSDKVET